MQTSTNTNLTKCHTSINFRGFLRAVITCFNLFLLRLFLSGFIIHITYQSWLPRGYQFEFQVSQTLELLKVYIVVNFRTVRLVEVVRKLTWTSMLIKKKTQRFKRNHIHTFIAVKKPCAHHMIELIS